jgi:hypothetical protein
MAKPKERQVNVRFVFTMRRDGEAKGDEAFVTLLKRMQTILGEKYNLLRLEVLHGDIPDDDSDSIFQWGSRWSEPRSAVFGPQQAPEPEPDEPEPDQAWNEGDLEAQVEDEDVEAALEDHDLDQAEAAEHQPDEPPEPAA